MIKSFENRLVKCIEPIVIKIARRSVTIFEKNVYYHCVFIENEYRVYGKEFIFHASNSQFEKHFRLAKEHRKKVNDE